MLERYWGTNRFSLRPTEFIVSRLFVGCFSGRQLALFLLQEPGEFFSVFFFFYFFLFSERRGRTKPEAPGSRSRLCDVNGRSPRCSCLACLLSGRVGHPPGLAWPGLACLPVQLGRLFLPASKVSERGSRLLRKANMFELEVILDFRSTSMLKMTTPANNICSRRI